MLVLPAKTQSTSGKNSDSQNVLNIRDTQVQLVLPPKKLVGWRAQADRRFPALSWQRLDVKLMFRHGKI
jgi:hypothetical protein